MPSSKAGELMGATDESDEEGSGVDAGAVLQKLRRDEAHHQRLLHGDAGEDFTFDNTKDTDIGMPSKDKRSEDGHSGGRDPKKPRIGERSSASGASLHMIAVDKTSEEDTRLPPAPPRQAPPTDPCFEFGWASEYAHRG